MAEFDTIAALSTPSGEGGIAIIRVSGPEALSIADKVLSLKTPISQAATHTLQYGKLVDAAGKIVDEVIATVMKAPRSYTREHTVEINCHAGVVVASEAMGVVVKAGARPAEPGEFTKRAFLNGRIDLTQAEAVASVIRARTDTALRSARTLLAGGLSERLTTCTETLLEVGAHMEATLDFVEDEIQPVEHRAAVPKLESVLATLDELLATERQGELLNSGARVAIVGKPNVGKSSLLNSLVGKRRAITDDQPGTTRDTIESPLLARGTTLLLVDTAGIREAELTAEIAGVARSWEAAEDADLILWVLDGSEKPDKEDVRIAQQLPVDHDCILVANKVDRGYHPGLSAALSAINWTGMIAEVSATEGLGIAELKDNMVERLCAGQWFEPGRVVLGSARQAAKIRLARGLISEAKEAMMQSSQEEIVSQLIREALTELGGLTGHNYSEELLETIFASFCIGK